MTTWTLVFILLGTNIHISGSHTSQVVIDGFGTEQACINAGNKIQRNSPDGNGSINLKTSFTCVSKNI